MNRDSSSLFSALIFVIGLKGLSPPPPLVSSLQAGVSAWRLCQKARGLVSGSDQRLSNRPEEKLSDTDWFRSRLVMGMRSDPVS